MFIGYPRSGHSLIGSLLDAHPNIVISHELDALYYFKMWYQPLQIYYLIVQKALQFTRAGRVWEGYNYAVPNQWQGRYEQIRVIGDKTGGRSTRRLRIPESVRLLYRVQRRIRKPMKMLHVIRNPFDNITTMVRRTNMRNGYPVDATLLNDQIKQYFKLARINYRLRHDPKLSVLDIYFEDFVAQPKEQLHLLIRHFGIQAEESYLNDCASVVWANPKKTRSTIDIWTPEMIEKVEQQAAQLDFLKRYRFHE